MLQMGATTSWPSATPKRPPSGLSIEAGTKSLCMSMTTSASSLVIAMAPLVRPSSAVVPARETHSLKSGPPVWLSSDDIALDLSRTPCRSDLATSCPSPPQRPDGARDCQNSLFTVCCRWCVATGTWWCAGTAECGMRGRAALPAGGSAARGSSRGGPLRSIQLLESKQLQAAASLFL